MILLLEANGGNLITLEDKDEKAVFGGGILYDDLGPIHGERETSNGLMIINSSESIEKDLPNNSLQSGEWEHVKIIFDHGKITVDAGNGKFTFTQDAKFTLLPEIRRIRITGWQNYSGARFDNIVVWKE